MPPRGPRTCACCWGRTSLFSSTELAMVPDLQSKVARPAGPSRRQVIRSAVAGSLLMPGLLAQMLAAAEGPSSAGADPLAPRPPHFAPKAKRVIFLYMSGGVSHVDSFDPKPRLAADHGKEVVLDHPETKDRPGYEKIYLKRPQWECKPRGRCGAVVSDMFPLVGARVDDLTVIRS